MRIKYENEKEKFKFEGNIEEFNAIFEAYKSIMFPAEKKEKSKIILDKETHSYIKGPIKIKL